MAEFIQRESRLTPFNSRCINKHDQDNGNETRDGAYIQSSGNGDGSELRRASGDVSPPGAVYSVVAVVPFVGWHSCTAAASAAGAAG